MKTFPAKFLNVDLDIRSAVRLDALRAAFDNQLLQLHSGRVGRRHWLVLTLTGIDPKNPNEAIRRFAKLVHRLPRKAATIWARATKEFDIGIQAGYERRSGEWLLKPQTIQAVADVGAHIRITVYSPLLLMRERSAAKRRSK